jgi:SAM-dependent methyltransferase
LASAGVGRHRVRIDEWAAARRLHRLAFATIVALPRPASVWLRRRLFNRLFESGAPWPYAECFFERAKRERLLMQIPVEARVLLEVGCADGHNLQALALALPDIEAIGVDISDRACALARERVSGLPTVEVIRSECAHVPARLPQRQGTVDVIVVSEVLYYLGVGAAFHSQVAPLRDMLAEGGRVIAVHTCVDALTLHDRLAAALGLQITRELRVSVEGRAFTLSVLAA